MGAAKDLSRRVAHRPSGWMDVRTELEHFALISYDVDPSTLSAHLPDRFTPEILQVAGKARALISVVPFVDRDFRFYRIAPFVRFRFEQMNYRAYVIDTETGERCAWFFGTTLDAWPVRVGRRLWSLPWHRVKSESSYSYNEEQGRYNTFRVNASGAWATADVELTDTGEPFGLQLGFEDRATQNLVLTHPVTGYFYRLDGSLGTYSIWHEEISLTTGVATTAYFSLLETLGLVSRREMQAPHSVGISRTVPFEVHMPPRKARGSKDVYSA